jgi:hypothetical protein
MVAFIIFFPKLVSVDNKTDMKEQIELKIDIPENSDYDTNKSATEFSLEVDPSSTNKEVAPENK